MNLAKRSSPLVLVLFGIFTLTLPLFLSTEPVSASICAPGLVFNEDKTECITPEAAESERSQKFSGNYIEGDCKGDNIQAGLPEGDENHCGILDIIVVVTNALSALVGIVVVASIIFGGIQYSSAGSDPQKISAAKDRIRNSIIALLFFIFTYAFLNWLIPGGVL